MSTGNAGAAIGLANTNKITPIGGLVADTVEPTAGVDYVGVNTSQYWDRNWLSEDANFSVPSNNTGKTAVWGTTGGSPVTVPADRKVAVSGGGVITAEVTTGAYITAIPAAAVIPAGAWLWVTLV